MKNRSRELEELKRKREELLERLNEKIARAQQAEVIRERKELTREKIIVGACVLAALEKTPRLRQQVEEILQQHATARDREFLALKGWLR